MPIKKTKYPDGWEIHAILDQSQHKRITKYFYKRKKAPRIELKDKISQQLAGYTLIEKDLRNAITWLEEIEILLPEKHRKDSNISSDRNTFNKIKGNYVAALTFY